MSDSGNEVAPETQGATTLFHPALEKARGSQRRLYREAGAQAGWDSASLRIPTRLSLCHPHPLLPFGIGLWLSEPERPFCTTQSVRGAGNCGQQE